MQLKQSLGVQTSAWKSLKVYGTPGVLESSGKNWRSFGNMVCNNGWYCVRFFATWFLSSRNAGFLSVLSHCFYQLVSFHLFHALKFHKHNFPKKTIHPKTNNDTWTWWFSKFRISFRGRGPPFSGATLVFVEETSSISSSFCTKRKPNFYKWVWKYTVVMMI